MFFLGKNPDKKTLIWIIIAIGIIGLVLVIFIFWYYSIEKSLQLISPNGKEELRAGTTHQIAWKSRRIEKINIMLIKEDKQERKLIVENFPAEKQKYDWQIFAWEEPRQDYKIVILEYPQQEESKVDYSDDRFTIAGPTFASCDQLSMELEWPFIPSDFPNLKRVFITQKSWTGNLEGLKGADKKCQEEAEARGLKGTWKAFLGDDNVFAIERLNLEGVFVRAESVEVLPQIDIPPRLWRNFEEFLKEAPIDRKEKENFISAHQFLERPFQKFLERWDIEQKKKGCHPLLGKNFEKFFKKFSDPLVLNQKRFDEDFLRNFSNLWLGRLNKDSKKNCVSNFLDRPRVDDPRNYSFTTTCQNWEMDEKITPAYRVFLERPEEKIEFPICYIPDGRKINAVGLAGLSSGLIITEERIQFFTPSLGKPCNAYQKLLCIEQ
jgi:hypothetical protein